MAQWNHSDRILQAKLVYYGPALGGKTTNLQQIHRITDPEGSSRLISLATSGDRTLFFDLLPIDLGRIQGFTIQLQLYTVPGQVRYDSTRRVVLRGSDGVVFVADSSPGRDTDNKGAWENLRANLRINGLDLETMPVVIQCNKRDIPGAVPADHIESLLRSGRPSTQAVAVRGEGVLETLGAVLEPVICNIAGMLDAGTGRVDVGDIARRAVESVSALRRTQPTGEAQVVSTGNGSVTSELPSPDELFDLSVKATMDMAVDYGEMRDLKNHLSARINELESLHESVREMNLSRDWEGILEKLARTAATTAGVTAVSILVRRAGADEEPVEQVLVGHDADPANRVLIDGETLAARLMKRGEIVYAGDVRMDLLSGSMHPALEDVSSLAAVPLPAREHGGVLLLAYGAAGSPSALGTNEMRFLSLAVMQAAIALDNAVLYRRMARYNESLEEEVRRRTSELRSACERLKELDRMKDRFLSSVSHEMKNPLTGILSTAEMLQAFDGSPEDREELLGIVTHEARRLDSIVEQIIQLWVLREGGTRLRLEEVDLSRLVERVVASMVSGVANQRGVTLRATPFDAVARRVNADPFLLKLALEHLLDNAVKFSPEGSTVDLEVRLEPVAGGSADGVLTFEITDSGPGFPLEERARLVDLFEQGGDLLTSKPPGLGIGLPLVREIARRHGGRLEFEEALSGGTITRLVLPMVPGTMSAPAADRAEVVVP